MAYVPTTFVDRSVEFPNRRTFTAVSGQADTFDIARAEGTVFAEGTKPDAANLNAEFGKIKTETDAINTSLNETGNAVLLGDFISTYSSTENRLIPNLPNYKYIQFVWGMNSTNNWIEPMISVELIKLLGLRFFAHALDVPGGRGLFFQYVDNTHIKCYCPSDNTVNELKVYGIK